MEMIPIEDLAPGEPVVTVERVERQLGYLAAGEELTAIIIFKDSASGRTLIIDGTNRVRALVEAGRDSVACERRTTVRPEHLEQLRQVAEYIGNGKEAFLKLPKVPDDEYISAQAKFFRAMRKTKTP